LLAFVAFAPACHGAGPYGHSPRYAELDEETHEVAGARDYDPVMVERQPNDWRKGNVTLFGVVEGRAAGPGGQALLKLSVIRLEPRKLCQIQSGQHSCCVP
jgi:hypothetical protein